MCGLAGYIDFSCNTNRAILDSMVKTVDHRGPDYSDSKRFAFDHAVVGLGHARLSVIDLTVSGHQPMHYGDLSIVYNGEVYNYKEIRKKLSALGHEFKTTSDTEVILHAYEQWGVKAVERFIGMFAIVIFDRKLQKIVMFRDRPGVKPLFYYWHKNLFLFASELKAFHAHPLFEKKIDLTSLATYFDFGYIPAPYSIFEHCHKLKPGHTLSFDVKSRELDIAKYWDVTEFYTKPKQNIPYVEAKDHVHGLLKSSCEYRMVSDVPVGVFLSGGYDSSAVTAILQKDRSEKLKTFTIGFEEGNNEAPYAKDIATYLGTEHIEYICTSKEAQDIIPTLPFFYDEPFADSSAIPTMLVSSIAQQHVTVALSADGGDELFSGYDHYRSLERKLNALAYVPSFFRETAKPFLTSLAAILPASAVVQSHRLRGLASSLNKDKLQQSRDLFMAARRLPDYYVDNMGLGDVGKYPTGYSAKVLGYHQEIEAAMAADYQEYLQNDILTKVDRATMSVSLEGREPLLDHRLVEYVATLPYDYKYDGRASKRILKDIAHEYIPQKMLDRPKAGFSIPISTWLRGDLGHLLDEFLSEKTLSETGVFNAPFLSGQVALFRENKFHYTPFIWKLLMFQMWYKRWMG